MSQPFCMMMEDLSALTHAFMSTLNAIITTSVLLHDY